MSDGWVDGGGDGDGGGRVGSGGDDDERVTYVGNSRLHCAGGCDRCCALCGRSWSRVSGRHRSSRKRLGRC